MLGYLLMNPNFPINIFEINILTQIEMNHSLPDYTLIINTAVPELTTH